MNGNFNNLRTILYHMVGTRTYTEKFISRLYCACVTRGPPYVYGSLAHLSVLPYTLHSVRSSQTIERVFVIGTESVEGVL